MSFSVWLWEKCFRFLYSLKGSIINNNDSKVCGEMLCFQPAAGNTFCFPDIVLLSTSQGLFIYTIPGKKQKIRQNRYLLYYAWMNSYIRINISARDASPAELIFLSQKFCFELKILSLQVVIGRSIIIEYT